MKIGAAAADVRVQILPAQGDGAANGQRWLADLEHSWLKSWQNTQANAASQGGARDAFSNHPDPAAAPSALPPEESRADTAPRAPTSLMTTTAAGLWTTKSWPAALSGMPYGASAAATPAPTQIPVSSPSVRFSVMALPKVPLQARAAEQAPLPATASAEPVAFHVALTESSAQVSLRDASLTPPEALHTGQAIARQLDALGVRAARVYVNGIAAHTTDESSHEPADPPQPSRLMATPGMPPRQIPHRLQEK